MVFFSVMSDISRHPGESTFDSLLSLGYRGRLVLVYLIVALLTALGLSLELRNIDDNMETLARERGAVLFRLIELTRDWNAKHGGVYVPVNEETQPNPYLKHPLRDLQTIDGMRLTMINPAFMTRQIAEIAEQVDGVRYHITSLKPIRPANAADPWETRVLQSFEAGKREVIELVSGERGPQHRYMAPLFVKQACLQCHSEQGYRVGDIRGGISIAMPAEKILAVRTVQQQRVGLLFGVGALFLVFLMHLIMWRSRKYLQRLREISDGQERLIAERTEALSGVNQQLLEEVTERKRKEGQILESEARYRSVIETSQNAIFVIEAPNFTIIFANEQAGVLLGMELSQIVGQPLPLFVHNPDRTTVVERLARRLRGETVSPTSRVRFARPDGSNVRVGDVHAARIHGSSQRAQWVISVKDVTERLADERELQIAAAVMESASEGIVVTDAANHIIQINPAFTAITGYRPQEVL
ncbi:MAG: DUF3365 domain-containing protein, partial [Betaproteobacteria bacterium]|nr:DUF3365 domain-containing protein [Betaproteobacteria bacterium]